MTSSWRIYIEITHALFTGLVEYALICTFTGLVEYGLTCNWTNYYYQSSKIGPHKRCYILQNIKVSLNLFE